MYTLKIQPRFAETDALGHLNNATLPVWFEQARTPIFKLFIPTLAINDWNLILAKIEIDFVREIFYGNEVEINTTIQRIGNSSFVVYQEVWQQQQLAAKGLATMVHFDHDTKKSRPIPESIRTALGEHMANQEPPEDA